MRKNHAVQSVTVAINYALHPQGFDRYQEYVEFYRHAEEVRNRGVKLDVEAGLIFSRTAFSTGTKPVWISS
ncbi:MAG: hypothetical protein FGF53_06840 [Candidatus Brockarchaeota archaeon]|nr:hypothetical protein [Candidatus Brockarchaeota archaeon]MBO3809095.1 hypothetical protein [Candidatus Brockarchaeota archaeon]